MSCYSLRLLTVALAYCQLFSACSQPQPGTPDANDSAARSKGGFEFRGGYPTAATVQQAYDEADLNRAVMAYRFFILRFPSWLPGKEI